MEIEVSQVRERAVTILRLKGDLYHEDPLRSEAQKAYEQGTRNILIDLSAVDYVSSRGLRGLHEVYTMLRSESTGKNREVGQAIAAGAYKSRHLKLLKPGEHALQALHVAGYDMFLEIYDNHAEAIASF